MLSPLKKIIIKIEILVIKTTFFFRSLKNRFKILTNNNIENFYIPNLSIKNVIMINPTKIKYRNSIPIKFKKKSTQFIYDFNWDKETAFGRFRKREL